MYISLLNKRITDVTVSGRRDSNIALNMAVLLLFRMAQQLSDAVPKGSLLHQAKLLWDRRRGLVLGVYVCVFVCMYICACVYLCVRVYMCICVCMCVYVHICVYV